MERDPASTYVGQVRYHNVVEWVDVALAATLREAAHDAALAYKDHSDGRDPIGVRVIRRSPAAPGQLESPHTP